MRKGSSSRLLAAPLAAASLVSLLAAFARPAGAVEPAPVQLPVVLDATGVGGAHYTADLLVVSLSGQASPVELKYTPTFPEYKAPGVLKVVTTTLEIGPQQRFYVPDVIAYLRGEGVEIPNDTSAKIGTLVVRLPATTDGVAPYVASRIATANPGAAGGSFGTFAVGVPTALALSGSANVYGLRENETTRTNLAVAHAGGGSNGPLAISIQLFDGPTGTAAGDPIAFTLRPGEWKQFSSILATAGVAQGWARVSATAGNDRFLTYASVTDGSSQGGGTSDGSFVEAGGTDGTLPIALAAPNFKTELVLANSSGGTAQVSVTYVAAEALTSSTTTGIASFTMPARTQMIEPDVIAFLRSRGLAIPEGGTNGGTLRVTGASAYARVYSPNPDPAVGGTFGVAFRSVPSSSRANTEAWIYGLRQDGETRSNVAVANAIPFGDARYTFEVTVLDASRNLPQKTFVKVLGAGQWFQWNAILESAGLTVGNVRVRCTSPGGGDFVAYGISNNGARPGVGTSDGSYIAMASVE